MAQIYTIKLTRNDPSTSWGFRLQGGKDFGTPLLVQKVNVGSLAEKSGLQAGDAILRVNNEDVSNKKHKEAQDSIVKAGNNFEITLQRGGLRTWKPAVIPIGSVPSPNPYITISPTPVTKTSLAAFNRQSSPKPPHGFNSAFNGKSDSENGPIKSIVNKQYNSPVAIYSDESIAETLSAQAEVLAGGVLGVNFKKNEKDYNAESSEVFKMVREAEKEPKSPEIERPASASWPGYHAPPSVGCRSQSQTPISGLQASASNQSCSPNPSPERTTCSECRLNIVGVFVRIKDKNLHVECFKCTTCGTSLKNVGYYSIENKLYCDIHAKMIARQKPSTPNTEPIVSSTYQEGTAFKPFSPIPTNNFIKPVSPQPSAFSPVPFHAPRISPSHVTASSLQTHNISNSNGIKSFRSTQPVSNSLFKHDPNPSKASSYFNPAQQKLPFLKPKTSNPSAFMPVMKSTKNVQHTTYDLSSSTTTYTQNVEIKQSNISSDSHLETVFESSDTKGDEEGGKYALKRESICSQEIHRVLSENKCPQNLSTFISPIRPESPSPSEFADEVSTLTFGKTAEASDECKTELIIGRPHNVRSLSPYERPTTPGQVVVFPPEVPKDFLKAESASPVPRAPLIKLNAITESKDLTLITETPANTSNTAPTVINCNEPITLQNSPPLKFEPGIISSILTTAPNRPYTPLESPSATIFTKNIPLPEETVPYQPGCEEGQNKTSRAPSPLVNALTLGPECSYSPLPKFHDYHTFLDSSQLQPVEPVRPSMAQALAVAPFCNINEVENTGKQIPELSDDPSIILTRPNLDPSVSEKKKDQNINYSSLYRGESYFPPIANELKAKFEKKKKIGSFYSRKSQGSVSPDECSGKRTPSQCPPYRPEPTDTGLHKPINVPHYQHCIKELSSRNVKKTQSSSRRSTPMHEKNWSLRSTPSGFEATISTQQKIFHSDLVSQLECCSTQITSSSATSFLTQSTNVSEKVAPVLGYKPCPLVERASFEKIEQCVQNIKERKIMECDVSPISYKSRPTSVCATHKTQSVCSEKAGPAPEKPRRRARSRTTSRTPDRQSVTTELSPIAPPATAAATSSYIITTSSGTQCFRPPPSPTTIQPVMTNLPSCKTSSAATTAASLISQQLSKTLTTLTSSKKKSNPECSNIRTRTNLTSSNLPNANTQLGSSAGANSGFKNSSNGTSAGFSVPRRGKGVWNPQNQTPGARIPLCAHCNSQIRGPFITALGKIWCPEHFICVNKTCRRSLLDIGFVEEPTGLYCEYCFEQFLAPNCGKCNQKVKGDCLNAIGKHFHPECFTCAYCTKLFGNNPFFLEDGLPYCENDWNELFTTKCFACGFPIEAGDRWVEALNNNYHSPCFNCTICKTNLEGQSFYAKGGRPFCKNHSH